MANINEFKSRLKGGGARASLFKVTLPFPSYAGGADETGDLSFLCKAASIPQNTIGEAVSVNFRGRELKLAGASRTFEAWPITVINDTDFKLYRAFERWLNGINNLTSNEGFTNPLDYQVDGVVEQLDRDSNSIKKYTLRGMFPTSLAAIALSYETNDAIEDFIVSFDYQWFETDTTT
jgi:hypothetical protein